MKKIRILLLFCAVAFVAAAITGCSAKAKKSRFLEQANHLFDQGKFDQAEIEYLNVLHLDPQNAQAIGRLGTIYFDEGRFQKAGPFLSKGSQLATNDVDLRLKLAQIYLSIGMLKEAHEQAEAVLEQDPQNTEAPVFFAQSVPSQKQIDPAQHQLHGLAQSNDNAGLETGLGVLSARENDFKTALTEFRHAVALDSHFAPAYAALANAFLEQDKPQEAEVAFKAVADCAPSHSPLQMEYGQFEIQAGNFTIAQGSFDKLTRDEPDYIPAWLGLAEVALDEKKLDDCTTALNKAIALDSDNVDAKVLGARLDLAKSDTARAIGTLEQLAKQYPQAPRIHYQLALAYVVGSQPNKALNQAHEAVDLNPNFVEAAFLLAQLELKSGDVESAHDLLKQLVARQPSLVDAKLLLADVYRVQNNFNGALEIYEELEKSFPKNPQIPLLAGTTFIQQLNEAAARQKFNRALVIDPHNAGAQEGLAQLDLADKKFDSAQNRVEQVITADPQQLFPQMLLARIFLAEGQTNQAETTLSKAAALPNGRQASLVLAQLYLNDNQNQKALDLLNSSLGQNPKDTSVLMLIAITENNQKDYRAAADTYKKVLALNPQYSPALNNLACLYCDNLGDLDKAYDLAQQARRLLPTDPSTADTLGWVLFKKGQYSAALKLFQESANKLPSDPEVQFHAGLAHYMLADESGAQNAFQRALDLNQPFPEQAECHDYLKIINIDPQSADATAVADLEKRISQNPGDPIAFTRLAAVYQRENNSARVIALCETVLKASPQNVSADLLLAQFCATTNPKRAFDLAKAAYQLKPDDAQVRVMLGHMAFLNGNDSWSYNLLESAAQDEATNAQAFFDLANAAFCVGKIADAQTAMQNAVQAGLPASQSADANNFLNIMALCQDPQQSTAAQTHINEILSANPDNPPALFADAIIQTRNGNSLGAEQDYEKLLAHHPGCTLAQKNLAILYAQNFADPVKAYPVALKAQEAFPDDPQTTKALGLILFQQGDYTRAASLFQTVLSSGSADAQVYYCLGISEFHLKKNAESMMSLQHALDRNLSGQEATDARETLAELKK